MTFRRELLFAALLIGFSTAHAGVLPEDRADVPQASHVVDEDHER